MNKILRRRLKHVSLSLSEHELSVNTAHGSIDALEMLVKNTLNYDWFVLAAYAVVLNRGLELLRVLSRSLLVSWLSHHLYKSKSFGILYILGFPRDTSALYYSIRLNPPPSSHMVQLR